MTSETNFLQPSRGQISIAVLVLIAAGIVAYANSLHGEFLFDDYRVVASNEKLSSFAGAWTANEGRPVAMLTFAANFAVHGNRVVGFHATNLAIHITAGLLLFGLVRTTLLSDALAKRFGRHATWLALAIALLWLVHPLQTQAVTYVVQRMESLMGLFFLATLLLFAVGVRRERNWPWFVGSVLCCTLGMLTKQVMFAAPLVLLWYDRAFVAKSWGELFSMRSWLYLLLACTWLLLPWSALLRLGTPSESSTSTAVAVHGLTPLTYLYSQAGVLVHYLRLSLWPSGQCFDYGWEPVGSLQEALLPGALILFLLGLTIWSTFRYPRWSFLGGCFFLILAPTSSFVPIYDLAVEHRMYLPLAAVMTAVVLLSYLALTRLLGEQSKWPIAGLLSVVGVLTLTLTAATVARNRVYRTEVTLWQDVAVKRPANWRGRNNLVAALLKRGKYASAIKEGEKFVTQAQSPGAAPGRRKEQYIRMTLVNIGVAHARMDRPEPAIPHFRQALVMDQTDAAAHLNLGKELRATDPDAAEEHFRLAIEHGDEYADAYNNLGAMLVQSHPEEARQLLERAIDLNPNDADTHNNLANLLAGDHYQDYELALIHYNRAIDLRPQFAQALRNRQIVVLRRNEQRAN